MVSTAIASTGVKVMRGASHATDARTAVAELREQIHQPDASGIVFFASSRYDLKQLGEELKRSFDAPIIGCTTAGEITPEGYSESSLTGFSIASDRLQMKTYAIEGLRPLGVDRIAEIGTALEEDIAAATADDPRSKAFGLFLIDGLSVMEEQVIGHIYQACRNIPIIGGSAGDDQSFRETHVYANGRFVSNAAVFATFITSLPFATFKTQHFVPSDQKLVITKADVQQRIVYEINGMPAADEYARLIGMKINQLDPMIFSKHPVMLRIGGEYYVRSIQKVNPDGSLTFFCAIDEGLVLTLSEGVDIVANLENALSKMRERVPNPELVLSCECILRRLEVLELGLTDRFDEIIRRHGVIGFHTYGEQYNAVHVNQTFTGIAIGGD